MTTAELAELALDEFYATPSSAARFDTLQQLASP
jgi:hypothetical protein